MRSIQNGVAFRSSLNVLKAELIKTDQRLIELNSSRKSLIETLGLFVNQNLNEKTVLEKLVALMVASTSIDRPEIKLFSDRSQLLSQQNKIIKAKIFRAQVCLCREATAGRD